MSSIYYVYKITNKITGEFYFGSRTAKVMCKRTPEEDLWAYYFTSSSIIKKQIEQYGIDSFETEILHKYPNNSEAAYWHEQLHIMASSKNPLCLNKYYIFIMTAKGKFCNSGQIRSAETRAKMSASKKNMSDETKAKMSTSAKGKIISKEHRERLSISNKGKIVSDETRAKLSAASRNMSDETKEKISEAAKNKSVEWRSNISAANKGRVFSDEWREKISASRKGKKHSEETKKKMRLAWESRRNTK